VTIKWTLSSIQLLVAGGMLIKAESQPSLGNWGPPLAHICYGLNAPALVASRVPRLFRISIPETAETILFLACVWLLWYAVGYRLEVHNQPNVVHVSPTLKGVLGFGLLSMVVLLLITAGEVWQHLHWWSVPVALTEASLHIIWAVLLLTLLAYALVSKRRASFVKGDVK
jgi:hypothetical protein